MMYFSEIITCYQQYFDSVSASTHYEMFTEIWWWCIKWLSVKAMARYLLNTKPSPASMLLNFNNNMQINFCQIKIIWYFSTTKMKASSATRGSKISFTPRTSLHHHYHNNFRKMLYDMQVHFILVSLCVITYSGFLWNTSTAYSIVFSINVSLTFMLWSTFS